MEKIEFFFILLAYDNFLSSQNLFYLLYISLWYDKLMYEKMEIGVNRWGIQQYLYHIPGKMKIIKNGLKIWQIGCCLMVLKLL